MELITRRSPSDEANSTLWLLAQIYAHRSVSLWKIPETLAWLNQIVREVSQDVRANTGSTFRNRSSLFAHLQGSRWRTTILRHANIADIKALAPFLGSILAHFGSQDAYDPFPPEGDGVTYYNEAYLSQASADTAKKRQQQQQQQQQPGGRRRRGGAGMVDIDPIDILQTLEAILSLDMDADRRAQMLGVLQEGHGATIVRQLEVSYIPCGNLSLPQAHDTPSLLEMDSAASRSWGTISPLKRLSSYASRSKTTSTRRASRGWKCCSTTRSLSSDGTCSSNAWRSHRYRR